MAGNESFKDVMDSITLNLTGDPQKDLKYLNQMMEQYKDHKYASEIIRAIGRVMYDLLPEEGKEQIAQLTKNQEDSYQSVLEEVKFNMYKEDYDKALSLIEPLIHEIDEKSIHQDDSVSEYYSFNEAFEEILYKEISHPEREVRRAPTPYSNIYFLYGNLLVEMERIEEAEEALKKALRWNPCSSQVRFEYIETLKMQKRLEDYQKEVCNAFQYIFYPSFLARAYRDLGYYFIDKEMYPEAVTMYQLSLHFDPDNKVAVSELYYIEQSVGKQVNPLSMEELTSLAEKYGFPVGPDQRVLELSYGLGNYLYKNNDPEHAKYFLQIAYYLTHDDELKELIAHINKSA